MTEPLSLVPLAVAAHGGHIDDLEAQQLIAAGLTLLSRCAPLVRALMGKRTAILLPNGPEYLTALAASEGRGALLIDPATTPAELAHELAHGNVGAVITLAAYEGALSPEIPRVLLDESPASATFVDPTNRRVVDLGSHVGLEIAGEADAPGRDEEAVVFATSGSGGTALTHRELLADARATIAAADLSATDHALATLSFAHRLGLTASLVAPLLAGARVMTMDSFDPRRAADTIERAGITMVAGLPETFAALLREIESRGGRWSAGALRVCLSGGDMPPGTLANRWRDVTGVALTRAPVG